MKTLAYARSALRQTVATVRAAPLLPAVAIASVALGVVFMGMTHCAAYNLTSLLRAWGENLQLAVYLEPGTAPARGAVVAEALRRVPGVDRVRYVTSAEALERLRQGMGTQSPLIDGVEEDMLQPSLEVTFLRGHDDAKTVLAVAERVARMPGISDVETMGDWVRRLAAGSELARGLSAAALVLVGLVCLYLVGATIKLAVYARRDEIEILRLVGATASYVRAPFWLEGALEGLLGAVLGVVALVLLHRTATPRLELLLGGVLGGVKLTFLPLAHLALAVAGAVVLGALSAHLAVRRYLQE